MTDAVLSADLGAKDLGQPTVAFVFNHDQIHQIAHALPIAIALAESDFKGELIIAISNPLIEAEVRRVAGPMFGNRIRHYRLEPSRTTRILEAVLGLIAPVRKALVYRDNLDFFRDLDMIVVTEKTSLVLKNHYRIDKPFMVHTRHGAGDRAIGFDRKSAMFDHVLCSGPLIRERLIEDGGVQPDQVSIIGYPKFDTLALEGNFSACVAGSGVGAGAGPTVLYNPHSSPHLSSWYRDGRAILETLTSDRNRNVIFAPHMMLFRRPVAVSIDRLRIARPGRIPKHLTQRNNLQIDLGSRASSDMTYTQAADIYVGDASSQVYEFLLHPKPCVFVNSHDANWRGNPDFAHWQAGPVIDRPEQLSEALEEAVALHETMYRPIQRRLFAERFDLTDTPSGLRGARRLLSLLDEHSKVHNAGR